MKVLIPVIASLFLFIGCSQKIVPGKVAKNKNTISAKEFEQKEILPKKEEVLPPVTKEQVVEEKIIPEEEIVEENKITQPVAISSKPYKITLKTKKFAFSDTGFFNRYEKSIELQVFTMGKLALDLKISLNEDDICVDQLCNTKHGFNQTFLTGEYPDKLVENVLQSKPIFGGKHLRKTTNGFMQKIITDSYAIKYKVWPGNVYFKDSVNHIMIKLKKLPK